MIPHDTHPEAHQVQMAAYRAMSPERRIKIAAQMSVVIRHLARAGIRLRHPDFSDAEVSEALVALLYDNELASKRRAES